MKRVMLALLLALSLASMPSNTLGYVTGAAQWKSVPVGQYTWWVTVCHWNAHPLPGGYGGAYWESMHRAVDITWNNIIDITTGGRGELHFSLSATPCGAGVPEPYVAIGMRPSSEIGGACAEAMACADLRAWEWCYASKCIKHANITLDPGVTWYTGINASQIGAGQTDAQTAFSHELGHTLTLEHECAVSGEIMCQVLPPGTSHRTLTSEDVAGYWHYYWYRYP